MLSVHPRFQGASTSLDAFGRDQVAVIARLLEERNDGTVGDGRWILAGLSAGEGAGEGKFIIGFCRYGGFLGLEKMDTLVGEEAVSAGGDETLEDTEIMITGQAEFFRAVQTPAPRGTDLRSTSTSHHMITRSKLDSRASTLIPTMVLRRRSYRSTPGGIETETRIKQLVLIRVTAWSLAAIAIVKFSGSRSYN
ncbi:hypothetical protein RUND412_001869 [Rhizina undulata]